MVGLLMKIGSILSCDLLLEPALVGGCRFPRSLLGILPPSMGNYQTADVDSLRIIIIAETGSPELRAKKALSVIPEDLAQNRG